MIDIKPKLGHSIEQVKEYKYLGLIIDENLTGKSHIFQVY